MVLYFRLLLIALVLLLVVWFVRRLVLVASRDPRLRQLLSNLSFQLLRVFLIRGVLGFLWRAVRLLRFFR